MWTFALLHSQISYHPIVTFSSLCEDMSSAIYVTGDMTGSSGSSKSWASTDVYEDTTGNMQGKNACPCGLLNVIIFLNNLPVYPAIRICCPYS